MATASTTPARAGGVHRRAATGWGLLAPALLLLVCIRVIPLLVAVGLSFTDLNLARPQDPVNFVGLTNYSDLLSDDVFHEVLGSTALIMIPALALEMALGLAIALWLNRLIRGRAFARSVLLVPFLLTPVVIGTFFRMFYSAEFGQLNYYLDILGITGGGTAWLTDPGVVRWAVVAMEVWHTTPFVALLLLAGLVSLPTEPQEAAVVDGASRWQRFRYVVLPMLAPILLVVFCLRAIDILQLFDEVYVLTGGGPGRLTEVYNLFLYDQGFQTFELGYTSAAAIVLMLGVAAIGAAAALVRSSPWRANA
jgi:multiple sugar transport system permease protein